MHIQKLFDLTGKVALVTGGYTGLGWQMAQGLGEAGAKVAICARRVERCHEAAKRLEEQGITALALKCDVADGAQVDQMVHDILAQWGKIDILVNNAGISWGQKIEEMTVDNWEKVLKVNLSGTFFCCQRVGQEMIAAGGGKIINISSVTSMISVPSMEAINYIAAKGGVNAITRDLAVKWAKHGVYVNALAPGFFATHMSELFLKMEGKRDAVLDSIPLNRLGGEYDLKGAAVFLASAASDFVTGTVLVVDGGHSAW